MRKFQRSPAASIVTQFDTHGGLFGAWGEAMIHKSMKNKKFLVAEDRSAHCSRQEIIDLGSWQIALIRALDAYNAQA